METYLMETYLQKAAVATESKATRLQATNQEAVYHCPHKRQMKTANEHTLIWPSHSDELLLSPIDKTHQGKEQKKCNTFC